MYRKIAPDNINSISSLEIPKYLIEEIDRERTENERIRAQKEEKLMQIELKICHHNDYKLVYIRRDKTLDDLKSLAQELLGIKENWEDFRVRLYGFNDTYMNTYADTDSLTLEKQGLASGKSLIIETKEPHEVFEEYDKNKVTIKVNIWRDEIAAEENATFKMKTRNPKRIQVSKMSSLADLLDKIAAVSRIPVGNQMLFKTSNIPTISSIEELNYSPDWNKPLFQLSAQQSTILYVEQKSTSSQWKNELKKDMNRVTIQFNDPRSPLNEDIHSLVVNKDSKLEEIKSRISMVLGIPPGGLVLKYLSSQGTEIKDLSQPVSTTPSMTWKRIHVELGTPCTLNQIRIEIFLAELNKSQPVDSQTYKFYALCKLPLDVSTPISRLKQDIVSFALDCYPTMQLSTRSLLLREMSNMHLTQVLAETETLRSLRTRENKSLALQESPALSNLLDSHLILVLRKWSPSTWELTPPTEIPVPKSCVYRELAWILSSHFKLPDMHIEACSVLSVISFSRSELPYERWIFLFEKASPIAEFPFYAKFDGSQIIIKDSTESLREMTTEEKSKYCTKPLSESPPQHRENGVKITVRKK